MKHSTLSLSKLVALLAAAGCLAAVSARSQTYAPSAWVNDPFSTNANWTVLNANTASPVYTNHGPVFNGNLFGNSPIGTTITLNNPGDSAILTGQVSLIGTPNAAGNVQFRVGMYLKGASANDTGWAGYMLGNVTGGGGAGL